MYPKLPATITVEDHGGNLVVVIDRGHGWEWLLSTPTHRGAMYQEARDRGMTEAQAKVAEVVEKYRRIYDVTTV